MPNILEKLPNDVIQIGIGSIAGTIAMYAAQYMVAIPMNKKLLAYRKKLQELNAAGKLDEVAALEKRAPLGNRFSSAKVRDISVLAAGIIAKSLAPKNTYTEYATDGIIFFALTSIITKNINFAGISYSTEKNEDK
jgi:hypothetical protein